MDRSLRLRTLILGGILTFCVLYLAPTFMPKDSLPSWFFSKEIQLGLDLQGGAHFVYSIDLNKAVDDKASDTVVFVYAFQQAGLRAMAVR